MKNNLIISLLVLVVLILGILYYRVQSMNDELLIKIEDKDNIITNLKLKEDSLSMVNDELSKKLEFSEKEALRQAQLVEEALSKTR